MRAKNSLPLLMLIINPLCLPAQGIEELADKLCALDTYVGSANFEVLLPSAEDPVEYAVVLQSAKPVQPDSLSPCDYLIRWSTNSPSGLLEGFSAYFDGNHYRYRNNRLQEYHRDVNATVFEPNGPGSVRQGVQRQAQFADMLPQFVGDKLREISADSAYSYHFHPDTIVGGRRAIVVDGVKTNMGYEVMEYTYVFDHATQMPVLMDIVTSPGSISEQLVTITYLPAAEVEPVELTEEGLIGQWPEVFEKYRESTFRAENLVGNPLPSFSCQILGQDERWSHNRGDQLDSESIFVILDPSVATTAQTIAAVRDAVAMLPMKVQVYWAFNSNRASEITELVGVPDTNEMILPSASALIRNCGITMYPTILLANSTGEVTDVLPGYNQDIASIVIQKCMLSR